MTDNAAVWAKLDKEYAKLEHLKPSLWMYVKHGVPTGGFLAAVLTNDLKRACSHADERNVHIIPLLVRFLYNNFPAAAWGSERNYEKWMQHVKENPGITFGANTSWLMPKEVR